LSIVRAVVAAAYLMHREPPLGPPRRAKGDVQVLDAGEGEQVLVFTIGLSLVGKSELMIYCSEESVAVTKELMYLCAFVWVPPSRP
jgi:hypothetical protein